MPVVVGVAGPGYVVGVLFGDHGGHRVRAGAVHADLAVPVRRHEAEGRIDQLVDHRGLQAVARDDRIPVAHRGTAERVDADAQPAGGDRLHVDHRGEVVHVGRDVVVPPHQAGAEGGGVAQATDLAALGEDAVRHLLDPVGDVGCGRAAMRRIVFEAAILRRVVRGRDQHPVGEALEAAAIIGQDRVAHDGRRRVAVLRVDHHRHTVGREHLDRAGEGGLGQRVGIAAEKQRAVDARLLPVQADRLADRQDVHLVEAVLAGGAAMPRGAERHPLGGEGHVRLASEIAGDQAGHVDQVRGRDRLSRLIVGHHVPPRGGRTHIGAIAAGVER